uniref:Major facilitator superfamily domain-containing protein 12 n=1 Tax=Cacopsylla melanoneura TaxID=428564 RepID=A0A8D8UCT1_9HEMI
MDQDEEDDDEEPAEESIDFESMVIDVVDRLEESSMSDDGEEENEPLLLEEGGYQQRGLGGGGGGKRYSQLRSRDKLAYGLGHVFNDICAALWFSYSLIFLQNVVGLGSFLAGILLFLGQAVDAVSTPISGKIIDESGNRKKWYLTGSILVIISFPLIFMNRSSTLFVQLVYYSSLIILFQMGWALTQISHLSIIPDLSESPRHRAELTALRYTASVFANILVYVIAWLFLHGSNSSSIRMDLIGPQHSLQFRKIALVCSFVGVVASILFYCLLQVRRTSSGGKHSDQTSTTPLTRTIKSTEQNGTTPSLSMFRTSSTTNVYIQMFKCSMLYKVSILYTTSRLFLTISLIYVPIYINEYYSGTDSSIVASVPLASFLASLAASLSLKSFQSCAPSSLWRNNQFLFVLGSLAGLAGCVIILWTPFNADQQVLNVYAAAICFGLGSSVTMVISLCSTANLVGSDTQYGAFIYSTVTFSDKLLNGVAVILIEYLRCESKELCPTYYRQVLSYVNGALSIIGIVGETGAGWDRKVWSQISQKV